MSWVFIHVYPSWVCQKMEDNNPFFLPCWWHKSWPAIGFWGPNMGPHVQRNWWNLGCLVGWLTYFYYKFMEEYTNRLKGNVRYLRLGILWKGMALYHNLQWLHTWSPIWFQQTYGGFDFFKPTTIYRKCQIARTSENGLKTWFIHVVWGWAVPAIWTWNV